MARFKTILTKLFVRLMKKNHPELDFKFNIDCNGYTQGSFELPLKDLNMRSEDLKNRVVILRALVNNDNGLNAEREFLFLHYGKNKYKLYELDKKTKNITGLLEGWDHA